MDDNVVLDGLPGYFLISDRSVSFSWIDVNYINSKRKIEMHFKNVDEFKEILLKILHVRFWKDRPIYDENEYLLQEAFSQMMNEAQNKEMDKCYVCLEDAKDYKTPCMHPICYPCFIKSSIYKNVQGDDFYEFACGICRRKKINFCP